MTFILAVNLSDRILLAGDTVVTRKNSKGGRDIVCYYPKLQQFSSGQPGQCLSVLFAGDLEFAKFLSKRISRALDNKELPVDIVKFHELLPDFLKTIIINFAGKKKINMIFAGKTFDGTLKVIDFKRLNLILGPSAGKIDDPILVQALGLASKIGGMDMWDGKIPTFLPRQEIFQVKINEDENILDFSELHGSHRLITAGTRNLTDDEKIQLLQFFLDRRNVEAEGEDLINYIRNQFSDSIGGAVMLGVMLANNKIGGMSNVSYNVDRSSGVYSDKNWSLEIRDDKFIAISPTGEEIDILKSHYDQANLGNLEI